MFKKIKEYFVGDLLRDERDAVRYANVELVYYINLLCLALLIPLQVVYTFTAGAQSQITGVVSIAVFLGALFLIKKTKKISVVSHTILTFSTVNVGVNAFLYPDMNMINGIMMAANILFAFNLLGRVNGFIYSFIHLLIGVVNIGVLHQKISMPFIVPVEQPLSVKASSFVVLFIIIVVLILYYQSAHKKAAQELLVSLNALTLSEERRKESQSVAHIGVWDHNLVTNELFWDEEMYRIMGLPVDYGMKRDQVYSVLHPDDVEYTRDAVNAALEGENYNIDVRVVRPTGEIRVVNLFGEVHRAADGTPLRFYGMIQDITDRKQAEDELKDLLDITSYQNTKLKNFAYIISHNIRSHSANISSLIDFLQNAETEEDRVLFTNMLKTNSLKLEDTLVNLNEMITVTESLSKPKDLKYLKQEVIRTLGVLNGVIYQHKIKVEVNMEDDIALHVVSSYLDSILLNLISNAVKYRSPERAPLIRISAVKEDDYVVLSVKDNGLGIDLEKHGSKLFGMYKTFHKNEDARGIGLFITKNHIESMKGKIEVFSKEGEGTEFKVYFNEKA